MLVSVTLGIVEPVSAAMLAAMVVRTNAHHRIPLLLRICIASLAGGLLVHAAAQVEMVFNYRTPRTWAWLALVGPVNAFVWVSFICMRRHERAQMNAEKSAARGRRPRLLHHP